MIERRRTSRVTVRAPVVFSWKARGGTELVEAQTDDISAAGMHITAPRCPPKDANVRCQVLLSPAALDWDPENRIIADAAGEVLRPEQKESCCSFAVRHREFALRDEPLDLRQWRESLLRSWRTARAALEKSSAHNTSDLGRF